LVGNLLCKADFSEINFYRKFILSEKYHLDIRIYSGTHPLDGTQMVVLL